MSWLVERLKPTPWSQLSRFGKAKRVMNGVFLLSSLSMAASAATASTDWDVHSDDPPPQYGDKS